MTENDIKGSLKDWSKNVSQIYKAMIEMQDDEFKAEVDVDLALRDMYHKPNPMLNARMPKSADKSMTSKQRIRMMQKEGIITRARHYKEDMSIF